MDIYVYQGAFHCSDCIETIKEGIPKNLSTYDADEYPQGPYDAHQQESDSPCHCSNCGVFLETCLTDDGRDYVRDAIENSPCNPATLIWADYYELD